MRFVAPPAGCSERGGVAGRALEAGTGGGPRAGICPPPTAAGRPPPRCSPPRCAKAVKHIKTVRPIRVFTIILRGEFSPFGIMARGVPNRSEERRVGKE